MARRARALTRGGALVATLIGAACILAGPGWVMLLLTFFITSSLLSRWHAAQRAARVAAMVEKGDERDAVQVLANGAVFGVAAVASVIAPEGMWLSIGAGAIAAATADTWSTEVGTAVGGTPRHILTGASFPPGLSGGITGAGSAAAVAAALVIALVTAAIGWRIPPLAVVAGGVGGAMVDSLLGATLQERRWCERCRLTTERRVHTCGTPTRVSGGVRGFTNDAVNLTSVLVGAVITGVLS